MGFHFSDVEAFDAMRRIVYGSTKYWVGGGGGMSSGGLLLRSTRTDSFRGPNNTQMNNLELKLGGCPA
jgi:hypothetical protein